MADLIRGGHRFADILDYTIPQIHLFHSQLVRLRLKDRADRIIDANPKDPKKLVKAIQEATE